MNGERKPSSPERRNLRLSDGQSAGASFAGRAVADLGVLFEAGCRYPAVYSDPPWDYDNRASRGAARNHYPTTPLDDLAALPVEPLVTDSRQDAAKLAAGMELDHYR